MGSLVGVHARNGIEQEHFKNLVVGKGIPSVNNPKRRGNHFFTVVVETPTKLSKEQKELLRQLEDGLDKNKTPKMKKFFDTLKDFFD